MNRIKRYLAFLFFICTTGLFAQAPSVTVLTPNGGEVWSGATTQNITWSSVNIANVIIEYSTNNGSNWINITTWPASAQTYAWVVPGAGPLGSNQCLVRIYDALNTAVVDQSDNTFTIPPSSITILQPNGGEQWPVGSLQAIVWQHASILNVDIEYSTNNGSNWLSVATGIPALRGFFNWTIPATISNNCIVRAKDAVNPNTVFDVSNNVFSIVASLTSDAIKFRGGAFDGFSVCENSTPSVTVTSPNGGETWPGATTQNITWTYNNIPNNVLIEVSYNNGSSWTSITTWPASAQLFPWVVSGPGSTQCLVRVSDAQNNAISDVSNNTFTIPQATLQVIQPNGGEQWPVGSLQSIVWNAQSVNNVNIDYSTNNGSSWTSIATNQTAQRGFFNWTIPATVNSNCLVRVTDASNGTVTDNSDNVFSIINTLTTDVIKFRGGAFDGFTMCSNSTPSITVTSPNGGEVWSGATTQNITWTYNNISNNVLIEFSTNNGSNWNVITTWPVTAGTYPWQVPGAGPLGSTQCLVRISDAQNLTLSDQSNNTFTIPGSSVLVVQPNGGEVWPVGSLQSIVWNVQSVLTVNIEYSTNNGVSWTTLATNYNSSLGFYNWVIPANLSSNCLVRVSDFANTTTVTDNSNAVFSIVNTLTVDAQKYRGGSYDGFTVSYTGCVPPTAAMTGNQTICAGQGANLSVNFTGSGPYVITYTDGTTPVTQSGITANPYVLTLSPTANTSYSLTALSNTCVAGPVTGSAMVTVGSGPSANITGAQTICQGNTAAISVTLSGSAPWDLTWTDGTNQTTQSGITASSFVFMVTPTASRTYTLVSVSSPACTGGLVSGAAIVDVQAAPTASLSGGGAICSGNSAVLTVTFTGIAPWDFVFTDGTNNSTQLGVTANPFLIGVTPASARTYTLVSMSNSCGTGTVSGSAPFTFTTPPSATLTGNQTICNGGFAQLSVAFTGNAPWDFTWSDGTTAQVQTGITAVNYVFQVTPAANTTYAPLLVTNGCVGTLNGSAVVIVNSGPTANISGNNTICGSGTVALSVALTGSSPWDITWTDGTNNTTLNGITSNPLFINVSPSLTTTYALVSVSSVGCPLGLVSGSPVVQVSPVPTATLTGSQSICAGSSAILSVALTGNAPWNISYSDGTSTNALSGITANPYLISVTPAVHTTYNMTQVFNICSGVASGSAAVNVVAPPTATLSGNQTLCGAGNASLTVAFTGVGPFDFTWTDGVTPVSITGITNQPYVFNTSVTNNTTFTLVSVSSPSCTTGLTSGSAIVTLLPAPSAAISGIQSICAGASAALSVALSGTAPWNFTWTDGVNPVSVTGITASVYVLNVTPAVSTTYSLTQVNDACGAGSTSGQAIVTVSPLPTATLSGNQTICSGSGAQLSVTLTGSAPWSFTWTDGVSPVLVTGVLTSPYVWSVSPISQTTYSLISVSNSCTGSVAGTAIITTTPGPSATISGSSTICTGQQASISVSLTGSSPWSFTWTDGTTPSTITGINATPYILFVTPTQNTTYALINVSSPWCTATNVGGNAIVNIQALPQAQISGSGTVCSGQTVTLSVQFTGQAPWNITWTDGTSSTTQMNVSQNPYLIVVSPVSSRTYNITSVSNLCGSGTFSGLGTVQIIPAVSATMSGSQTICTGNTAQLSVNLTGSAPWNITWTDGITSFPVTGATSNPYVISVSPTFTTTYVVLQVSSGTCTGSPFGSSVVQVVPGATLSLSGNQTICPGTGVQMTFAMTGTPPWNIAWTDGTTVNNQSGLMTSPYVVNLTPLASVTYSPVSIQNSCGSGAISGQATFTVNSAATAAISGNQTLCNGSSMQLAVQLTGPAPWSLTYTNGVSNQTITGITASPYLINLTPVVNTTYQLVSLTSGTCPGVVSGTATALIQNGPLATISGAGTLCPGQTAQISVNLSGAAPWNLTWTDGTSLNVVTGINASPYTFVVTPTVATTYSLMNVTSNGCAGTIGGSAQIFTQPGPDAVISGAQSICPGQSATLSVALSGNGPWDITWSDGVNTFSQNTITASPWVFSDSPAATSTYTVISVVEPGCAGGTTSGQGTILVHPAPSPASVGAHQSICATSGIISATAPTAGTGLWTLASGSGTILFPGNPVSNVTSLGLGLNTFTWTVTLGTCTSSTQLNIFRAIAPNPAQAGADIAICGNSTTLSATPAVNGVGSWSQVTGSSNIQNSTQATTMVTAMVPGTHTYVWSVSNGVCPAVTDTVIVNSALSVTQANAGIDQTVCSASAVLNGNLPNPGNGLWTVGTGTASLANANQNNSALNNIPMGQTYMIWTLQNAGCISFDTVIINRIAAPVASFTYQQTGYTFTFTNTSQNAVSAFWTFGDGNTSAQMNPVHTYSNPANYPVRLIVANGCGSDTIVISVSAFGVGVDATLITELKAELWPNPASDVVHVLWNGIFQENATLDLYDAKGQKVLVSGISIMKSEGKQWTLNTVNLCKGIYTMYLKSESHHEYVRFMLK